MILADGETIAGLGLESAGANVQDTEISAADTMESVEEKTIRAAMGRFGGNISLVAKSLNISRPTLYAKLKKYGI